MTAAALAATPSASATPRQRWLRRYGLAVAGGAVILFWFAVAFLAPVISPYNPNFVDIAARLQAPSAAHWLGTDALGRDVLSRVLFGSRISLIAGFSVVLISAVFGTVLGAIAAYARGRTEDLLMRLTDLVLCFPPIILAMAIAAALGIGTTNTIIAMLVVWWPKTRASPAAWCSSSARRNTSRRRMCWASATRTFCSAMSSPTPSGRWS